MGKGYCSMQNICRFAHGRDELRKHTDPYPHYLPPHVQISSLYKTQLCRVRIGIEYSIFKRVVVMILSVNLRTE